MRLTGADVIAALTGDWMFGRKKLAEKLGEEPFVTKFRQTFPGRYPAVPRRRLQRVVGDLIDTRSAEAGTYSRAPDRLPPGPGRASSSRCSCSMPSPASSSPRDAASGTR
jgi:hypothetical protein